jgi:hypothetical protein
MQLASCTIINDALPVIANVLTLAHIKRPAQIHIDGSRNSFDLVVAANS